MAWTIDYASGVLTQKFKDRVLEEVQDDLAGGCRVRFACGSSFHLAPYPSGEVQVTEFSDHGYLPNPESELDTLGEKVEDLEEALDQKQREFDRLEEKLRTLQSILREALSRSESKKDLEEALRE